jgi:hypothetical protein
MVSLRFLTVVVQALLMNAAYTQQRSQFFATFQDVERDRAEWLTEFLPV